MPGAVVKVSDLLLVLHHVGWLASLLVLHCNVVLDRLKILSMLDGGGVGEIIRCEKNSATHVHAVKVTRSPLPRRAPQRSCSCLLRSKTPTVVEPFSGYQPAPLSQHNLGLWKTWTLSLWSQAQAPTVPLSPVRKSHFLPLLQR